MSFLGKFNHPTEYLTFNDVALVPQYNNIASRMDQSMTLETWLTRHTKVAMPLVPANMDTVIGDDLADIVIANGGMPIFHRFASLEQQEQWVRKYGKKCYISCGLHEMDKVVHLFELGCRGCVVDIAHGHSKAMCDFIRKVKDRCPDCEVIAGNVCTALGYQEYGECADILVNAGADAVKVGVGCGAACTTRMKTGFGVPQFSAIMECAELSKKLRVPIIADGGIMYERDVCLALAAGANTVMMGSVFAKSRESAAPKSMQRDKRTGEERLMVRYRGQASAEFQKDYYGGMKKGTVAEGVAFSAPCTGPSQDVIDSYLGALRSSLTYGGARTIKEFQQKATFVKTTANFMVEAQPRPF